MKSRFNYFLALVLVLVLIGAAVGLGYLHLSYTDSVINSSLPGWLKVILT